MFDCDALFQHANPSFYRKHRLLSTFIIYFFRLLWKESEFKKAHALNKDKSDVELIAASLDYLHFKAEVPITDIKKIPATGPLVVVANHPNMCDGIALIKELSKVRSDIKMIGLKLLKTMPVAEPFIIPVDRNNEKTTAESIIEANKHLQQGGVVIFFPAGRLSDMYKGQIDDHQWGKGFFRFALDNNAPILPVYVELAKKHYFFWLAKILFPYCYYHQKLTFHIGDLLDAKQINEQHQNPKDKVAVVRKQLYSMREHSQKK